MEYYKPPNGVLFSSLSAHPHENLERGCCTAELFTIAMSPFLLETLARLRQPALQSMEHGLQHTHMNKAYHGSQKPASNCFLSIYFALLVQS